MVALGDPAIDPADAFKITAVLGGTRSSLPIIHR